MSLPPLATDVDVAHALGVETVGELPTSMQVRLDAALSKVSRRFRFEAQRIFTPGSYTHTLRIQAGSVRLMEAPSEVLGVRVEGLPELGWGTVDSGLSGGELDVLPPDSGPAWYVENCWLRWEDWNRWQLNGRFAQVMYSWDTAVPADVVASVADIAGRVLSVDPLSAARQSKSLMAGDFRQDFADWVSNPNAGFTEADVELARSYRYPAPPVIIQRLTSIGVVHASLISDGSWG